MLLACSSENDIFYFALLLQEEPKRAFLVEHKKLNNEDTKSMISQELVVLEDSKEVKCSEFADELIKNINNN